MIALQTKDQRDLMIEGAKKILIVDDTHNITQYENTRLLNVLVVDEHNFGWPVAHLISNSMTGSVIAYFATALKHVAKQADSEFKINCLITDDDPAIINGFESGFASKIRHILCQWHLDKTLQKNIREKSDPEMFQTIYDEIKIVIGTRHPDEFYHLYAAFLKKHENDSKAFVEYLKSHYSHRTEKWAMSSRVGIGHGNINTTSHVESFHNKLKFKYLQRIPNKRMDHIINVLLDIEKDDLGARKRLDMLGPAQPKAHLQHDRSLEIDDKALSNISSSVWQITSNNSSTEESKVYFIEQVNQVCCAI